MVSFIVADGQPGPFVFVLVEAKKWLNKQTNKKNILSGQIRKKERQNDSGFAHLKSPFPPELLSVLTINKGKNNE